MLKLGGAEFPDEYGEIIGRESLSATEFPQETPPPEAEWEGMVNERDASVPIDLPGLPEGSGHAVVYSQSLPHSEKYYQFLDPSGGDVEVVTGSEMFPGERQWLQEHGNFGDLPAPDIPSGEPGQHYLRHRRFVNLLLDPDTPGKAMTRGSKELPREALAIAESQQGLPIRAREMSSSVSGARGRQAVINHNMNHVKSAVHSLDSLAKEIAKDMVPDADGQYRLAGAIRVAAEELPGGSKPEAPDFSAMQLTPHPENPELNMWGVPLSEIRTQPELPGFEGGDGALARRLEEASPGITRDPVRSAKYFIEWLSRNRFIGSDGGVKPHDLGFTGQGGLSHLLTGSRDVSGAQFDSLLKDIYQVSESTYNNLLPPAESGNPTRLFVFGARSLPEAKGMYRQELERSGLLFSEDPAKRSQMIDRAVEEREYTSDPYKASPEKIGEKASVLEAIDHVRRNPHLEGILVPAAQTLKRSTFLPFGPKKDRSGKLQHARSILQYGHPKGRELSDEWSWVKSTDPEKVKYREDLIRKGKKGTMVKYIEHLTGVKSESVGAMGPAGSMRKDYEYIRLRDEGGNWYGPDKGRAVSKLMEFLKMGVPIIPGLSPFMMLQAMKDRR